MLLVTALLSEAIPLPAALNAVAEFLFLFWRHSGGNVFHDMRPRSFRQYSDQSRPECRSLGHKEAAKANRQEKAGDDGYLKPSHTLGLFGTM